MKVRGSVGGAYPPVVALRLTEAFTVSPQSVRPAPGMFLKDSRMGTCASLLQREGLGIPRGRERKGRIYTEMRQERKTRRIAAAALALMLMGSMAGAQDYAVKTNVLYDATLTLNAGAEVGLAPRWSAEVAGNYNGWSVGGRKWKHWLLQPELRWWFCDRFAGHFIGVHALGAQYNVGNFGAGFRVPGVGLTSLQERRYQGWAVGGGIAYGYAFILGRHWNLELEAGAGYVYTRYDVFECEGCGKRVEADRPRHYVGPTKAAVNLVYVF